MEVNQGNLAKASVWRLKKGADRRFRSGHPWVYSNELNSSPSGIEAGAPVVLQDAGGEFLAHGYGNPHSLISFRSLSRDPSSKRIDPAEFIKQKLFTSLGLRERLGLLKSSHRLCFGEADGLPGLVIDRFLLSENQQVFVVQAHTAGANRWVGLLEGALEKLSRDGYGAKVSWSDTGVLLKNDLPVRRLEGLEMEKPQWIKGLRGVDLEAKILVGEGQTGFWVNLLEGQKTGFFLDQSFNIELASSRLKCLRPSSGERHLKILDLCTYVGQWGAQLASVFVREGLKVEVTAVDSSASALEFAQRNIEERGAACLALRGDVLRDLETLPAEGFDLVISDPPSLIKSRKDIPKGSHAYLQLNTQAFRLVKKGGGIVTCSCSSLLDEGAFSALLGKSAYRNQLRVQWVARGFQAPDHPVMPEFPEGCYLKCWIGFAGPGT